MILLLFLLAVTTGKFVPPSSAYSIVPAAPRIREPCWLDIDGTERVAILFDYSMLMDTVLLGGEQSVGFRVRTHSLYIEPSFVQRLEYQCKTRFGNTPVIVQQQLNNTCAYSFANYPALSEQIPIQCYNSTYVYLNDTVFESGDSPAECSLLIETNCLTTHSEVLKIPCYAMFNYTNGITICNVWCRCASFVQAMIPTPSLGITPPPPPPPPPPLLNCTAYFQNAVPPYDYNISIECNATTYTYGCGLDPDQCGNPTLGNICRSFQAKPGIDYCCYCVTLPPSSLPPTPIIIVPTPTPTSAPTTILNCTQYFETTQPPFDNNTLITCRARIACFYSGGCPQNRPVDSICKLIEKRGTLTFCGARCSTDTCCVCVSFVNPSPPPTLPPITTPTLMPTLMPTTAPTAIVAPTSMPTAAPIGVPTAAPTAISAPTVMPTTPTSSLTPTISIVPTTSPSQSPAPTTDAGNLSGGEIIGIVLFVVVGLLIIALFIAMLCVRRSKGTTYFRF